MAEFIWIKFGVSCLVWWVKCLSMILGISFVIINLYSTTPLTDEEVLNRLKCSNHSRYVDCVYLIFRVRWHSEVSWSNNFEQQCILDNNMLQLCPAEHVV
jgi:hypothetical protein